MATDIHSKLVESLEAMEECCQVVEIESKSWHDFWVVQRAVVRALWVVLTWILRRDIMASIDTIVNEEIGHYYVDCDGIRLVYECVDGVSFPRLVGWYRPDGWEASV